MSVQEPHDQLGNPLTEGDQIQFGNNSYTFVRALDAEEVSPQLKAILGPIAVIVLKANESHGKTTTELPTELSVRKLGDH